jgi:hypothetical protein
VVRHTNADRRRRPLHRFDQAAATTRPRCTTRRSCTNAGGASRVSITRNTIGQIVERTDHWGDAALGRNVTGLGDPRSGTWPGPTSTAANGIQALGPQQPDGTGPGTTRSRTSGGNRTGLQGQIRDFRALDKGTSLKAEPTCPGARRSWRSAKFDAKGDPIPGTEGIRTWKQANGTSATCPGSFKNPKLTQWQDHDANGNLLRELTGDNKVREYTDAANGTHAWKEYNFGSVWRERQPVERASEPVHGEGELPEAVAGHRGRRHAAALPRADRPGLGARHFRQVDGGGHRASRTRGCSTTSAATTGGCASPTGSSTRPPTGRSASSAAIFSKLTQKTLRTWLQDFVIDVAANVIITGATDGWDFKDNQIASFLVGAAIRSGVKGAYGVLSETLLKDFRDGLRNMDSGKDFNRQPYANDKFWDNDWAGNENPTRWRSGSFDFFVGGTLVPAIGSFIATMSTGAAFGFGKEGYVLSGGDL